MKVTKKPPPRISRPNPKFIQKIDVGLTNQFGRMDGSQMKTNTDASTHIENTA